MRILTLSLLILCTSAVHAETGQTEEHGSESLWDKARRSTSEFLNSKEVEASKEKSLEAVEKVVGTHTSFDNRSRSRLSLFYIPFDAGLVIPFKSGFAATWIASPSWSLEAEYIKASLGFSASHVDLVEFSEELMIGKARWYPGNSFHLNLGYGVRRYKFGIEDEFISKVADRVIGPTPSFSAGNQVVDFGVGNRWQLDNGITLGADWLEIIVTTGKGYSGDENLSIIANDNDRKNVRTFIDYLRYGPTFNLLKIHVGYTF